MIRSPLMTVMTDAVMKASRSLKRDFGEVENLQVLAKGPGDFVSKADHKAEEILRASLEKARPGYGFVMEESGVVQGTDESNRWHIDPLDGTHNFLRGIPHWNISVALERDNQFIAGDEYTIADMAIWPWYGNGMMNGASYNDPRKFLQTHEYKNLARWTKEIGERPAVKRGMEAKLD